MKSMLIPPIPHLHEFGNMTGIHLTLNSLYDDSRYLLHYREEAKRGAYIILDNDCHEHGHGDHPKVLVNRAVSVQASEVVCPDALFKAGETVQRTTDALEYFANDAPGSFKLLCPRLMMVPQGNTIEEWVWCLTNLLRIHRQYQKKYPETFPNKLVIGLSKDFEIWEGGLYNLVEKYLYPLIESGEVDVHMLGWGRILWAYRKIADDFPLIRSVDSAKPFVFAIGGIVLDPCDLDIPEYPRRPKNYFQYTMTEEQCEAAIVNIRAFKQTVE